MRRSVGVEQTLKSWSPPPGCLESGAASRRTRLCAAHYADACLGQCQLADSPRCMPRHVRLTLVARSASVASHKRPIGSRCVASHKRLRSLSAAGHVSRGRGHQLRESVASELALDVRRLGIDTERADKRLVAVGDLVEAAGVEPIVAHVARDHHRAVVRPPASTRGQAVRSAARGDGWYEHLVENHHSRVLRVPQRVELQCVAHAVVEHRLSRVDHLVADGRFVVSLRLLAVG
mmetsp:Transcript_52509/g.120644  ORF Transcript_52509/g.120644 Transcript_52509/m.120644 type:complete len:234 (-) Transcript_52509:1583-2284(-)